MAVPAFPSTSLYGPFAANTFTAGSMTAFYIYAVGVSESEMRRLIGYRDKDGTLVDGVLTDQLQARTDVGDEAADLNSAVLEVDSDANSPYFGYVRLKITVAAAVA